jgi:hypothetical protein
MRTLRTLAVAMAATAVLPLAGMAQDTTPKDPASPTPPPAASSTMESTTTMDSTMSEAAVITTQKDGQVLSDSYIGASVVARSTEGVESVGKVSELLLDENDKIVGVVVDVGGFLGIAAKPVGLAWTGLSEEMSDGAVLLKTSLTREELEAAPEFKTLEAQQVEADRDLIENQEAPATLPNTSTQ